MQDDTEVPHRPGFERGNRGHVEERDVQRAGVLEFGGRKAHRQRCPADTAICGLKECSAGTDSPAPVLVAQSDRVECRIRRSRLMRPDLSSVDRAENGPPVADGENQVSDGCYPVEVATGKWPPAGVGRLELRGPQIRWKDEDYEEPPESCMASDRCCQHAPSRPRVGGFSISPLPDPVVRMETIEMAPL
jgi:hypothetical protein